MSRMVNQVLSTKKSQAQEEVPKIEDMFVDGQVIGQLSFDDLPSVCSQCKLKPKANFPSPVNKGFDGGGRV